jgi:hypothetical protein
MRHAVLCYALPAEPQDFIQATSLIWKDVVRTDGVGLGVGVGEPPSEPLMSAAPDNIVRADFLAKALASAPARDATSVGNHKVGDRVDTKWGVATLMSEHGSVASCARGETPRIRATTCPIFERRSLENGSPSTRQLA